MLHAIAAAIAAPVYLGERRNNKGTVVQMSPEAAEALLARERRVWADAVRATGATAS